MTVESDTLSARACRILLTPDPGAKSALTRTLAADWRAGRLPERGRTPPPDRPARPERPELRLPRDMPKRRSAGSEAARVALLHALAHIELNAIDLALDLIVRFACDPAEELPDSFVADWLGVADDEARHFLMLEERLGRFGARYGDHPAHDGLWQAAEETSRDLLARIAVVPLVLEARGLDVTPAMIEGLTAAGDLESAACIQRIHDDEIAHVGAGRRWFDFVAIRRGLDPDPAWQAAVRKYFKGKLKRPFNVASRSLAGMEPPLYEPLADDP